MVERAPVEAVRCLIFAPLTQPPVAGLARAHHCATAPNVSENEIKAAVAAGDIWPGCSRAQVRHLLRLLRRELKRLIAEGNKTLA